MPLVDLSHVIEHGTTTHPMTPAHTTLPAAGIPIVEHLTGLGEVPAGARFTAVRPAIRGPRSTPP